MTEGSAVDQIAQAAEIEQDFTLRSPAEVIAHAIA
jgi:hypothetical protein